MPSSVELFSKYPNQAFVETGTFHGQGVESALKCGFSEIRSIELYEQYARKAVEHFSEYPQVRIFQGASEDLLCEAIADIKTPITFFLDAHYSGEGTAKGERLCPLLKELEIIANHPLKTHTILIDDRRLMGTSEFEGITEQQVCDAIIKIHPAYNFSYDDGGLEEDVFRTDVLVANRIG